MPKEIGGAHQPGITVCLRLSKVVGNQETRALHPGLYARNIDPGALPGQAFGHPAVAAVDVDWHQHSIAVAAREVAERRVDPGR